MLINCETVSRNLEKLRRSLECSRAIVVQGAVGCGKTESILQLSKEYKADSTLIQIDVDDTYDNKDLLGKFSASETLGAFDWYPGPLTIAVEQGYWLLMEDIDLASFDVFSVLISLLQNGELFIPDKNTVIKAHPSFKLIGTQQLFTSSIITHTRKSNAIPFVELWNTVILEQLSCQEMVFITSSLYPCIPREVIISLAEAVKVDSETFLFSLRHLLRWAKRVNKRLYNNNSDINNVHRETHNQVDVYANENILEGVPSSNSNTNASNNTSITSTKQSNIFLSSSVRELMLREAFDCVVASFPPGLERDRALECIASACGVPVTVAIPLLLTSKPFASLTMHQYAVGRVHLPCLSAMINRSRESRVAFAPTQHALSLLERLAAAVENKENVLLTGETGIGKTFIIQYLADQIGQRLIVHNLNQQTDIADFIGGWKPLDVGVKVRELYREFVDLFAVTFDAGKNVEFLSALQRAVRDRKWVLTVRQIMKSCKTFYVKRERERAKTLMAARTYATHNHAMENTITNDNVTTEAVHTMRLEKTENTNTVSESTHTKEDKVTANTDLTDSIITNNRKNDDNDVDNINEDDNEEYKDELLQQWHDLENRGCELLAMIDHAHTNFAFTYEEGSLVKAWREGAWILLDEINLASTEVLERVAAVLGESETLYLADRNASDRSVRRHPNFHVFANMNPPTDVGKKDLPPSLRARFTEFFVSEPYTHHDIAIVIKEYIGYLTPDAKINEIASFFLECVSSAKSTLCAVDGETKPPSFSLRTLTRALSYVRQATPLYGFTTALLDGLLLGFATPLPRQFHSVVETMIVKSIFANKRPPPLRLPPDPSFTLNNSQREGQLVQTAKETNTTNNGRPKHHVSHNNFTSNIKYIPYAHIWIAAGNEVPFCDERFILTDSVRGHLIDIARAVFVNRPVLLEGPTSSGKSSMIKYLAELTGNKFVRINNHDSTEVQEYLGQYITDEHGKLRFVDGILVNAVRYGYWVVLDELNLAPTEVLEALNRLLDDNCELFISDTQETIKPHRQLRIFATQNPAGIYGGRKLLSRAFRNRFLEITVDDIPAKEISTILQQRYSLPASFADKMIEVMTSLQLRRQGSQIFAGRHGFITPRDLFRWAERHPETYLALAEHGFLLLGERCRKDTERMIVKDVIESVMKVEINEAELYSPQHWPFVHKYYSQVESGALDNFKIVWTSAMQRLFTIVGICLEHREPVLLVGETGSSKTTMCQLWASLLSLPLHMINCHQHTEAADFLGGLRPAPPERRQEVLFEWHNGPLVQSMLEGSMLVLDEISLTEDSVLERLNSVLEPERSLTLAEKNTADYLVAQESFRILATMNPGGDFGKKELSPALRNRFTEIYVRPTTAKDEVAHILRARLHVDFHQWAEPMASVLCCIANSHNNNYNSSNNGSNTKDEGHSDSGSKSQKHTLLSSSSSLEKAGSHIQTVANVNSSAQHISIRDIVSWVEFMNATHGSCPPYLAFLHGLDAIVLDGIGVGTGQSELSAELMRKSIVQSLDWNYILEKDALSIHNDNNDSTLYKMIKEPFWCIFDGMTEPQLPPHLQSRFFFGARATQRNLSKLMRASVLPKAVLLEGSPGVGKTSIVEALAAALHRPIVRINLSEQTDMMDLLGTFLPRPVECDNAVEVKETVSDGNSRGSGPQFAWSDGVLLRAVKEGAWVILDELNLASQSVLEGLNALLDHRSAIFIPELNAEFHTHVNFRLFACQNPLTEGGGRKGLPRSFLNRFLRVRIEAFDYEDLLHIAYAIFPCIAPATLEHMVRFVTELQEETMILRRFAHRGSPWEFNLRDILRWGKMAQWQQSNNHEKYHVSASKNDSNDVAHINEKDNMTATLVEIAEMLFIQRMRCAEDAILCKELMSSHLDIHSLSDARNGDFLCLTRSLDGVYFDGKIIYKPPSLTSALAIETISSCSSGEESNAASELALYARVDDEEKVATSSTSSYTLSLLPSQAQLVKSLLVCASNNQFALIIGPSASGKTFALRTAATLAGATLVTFNITASCDTVDLLGGFDQVEGKQGEFGWRDSLIVEAMLHGHWLVLDNVNFCHASVLDRLNPLVEPDGVLSMNEQGLVNNSVRVIKPHPAFRLFATLNPKYGDISRAMRNRAVEINACPLPIPSIEVAALCTNVALEVALSSDNHEEKSVQDVECDHILQKTENEDNNNECVLHNNNNNEKTSFENVVRVIMSFHQLFVQRAFAADTTSPYSGSCTDALANNAPNLFTLLAAIRMITKRHRLNIKHNEELYTLSCFQWDEVRSAIAHHYLDNRLGHWRSQRHEYKELLEEIILANCVHTNTSEHEKKISNAYDANNMNCNEKEGGSTITNTLVSDNVMVAPLELWSQKSQLVMPVMSEWPLLASVTDALTLRSSWQSHTSVRQVLIDKRVQRAGIALCTFIAKHLELVHDSELLETRLNTPFRWLLMHFVLDQCNDNGVSSSLLMQTRLQFISRLMSSVMSLSVRNTQDEVSKVQTVSSQFVESVKDKLELLLNFYNNGSNSSATFSTMSLPLLYSYTFVHLGPYADIFFDRLNLQIRYFQSALLNNKATTLLTLLVSYAMELYVPQSTLEHTSTSSFISVLSLNNAEDDHVICENHALPEKLHQFVRLLVPLWKELTQQHNSAEQTSRTNNYTSENYITVVTFVLLLHAHLMEHVVQHSKLPNALERAFTEFFAVLQQHLHLPFELNGKESILAAYLPRIRCANKDERVAMSEWQQFNKLQRQLEQEEEQEYYNSTPTFASNTIITNVQAIYSNSIHTNRVASNVSKGANKLITQLWKIATFRDEFRLFLMLQHIEVQPSISLSMSYELQSAINNFIHTFTRDVPVMHELEITLWRALSQMKREELTSVEVAQFAPLLLYRLIARYGLDALAYLEEGSWTVTASSCVRAASRISISELNDDTSNNNATSSSSSSSLRKSTIQCISSSNEGDMTHDAHFVLYNIRRFLSFCPRSSSAALAEHSSNAQCELTRMMQACTMPVQEHNELLLEQQHQERYAIETKSKSKCTIDDLCSTLENIIAHKTDEQEWMNESRSLPLLQHLQQCLKQSKSNTCYLENNDNSACYFTFSSILLIYALKCRLLPPHCPIDPMFKQKCKVDVATSELALLSQMLRVFTWADEMTLRNSSVQQILLCKLRDMESQELQSSEGKYVARPESTGTRYATLIQRLHEICHSLFSDERLFTLTPLFKIHDDNSSVTDNGVNGVRHAKSQGKFDIMNKEHVHTLAMQREQWSELLSQHALQLVNEFGGYEDVTLPFVESLLLAAITARMSCNNLNSIYTQQQYMLHNSNLLTTTPPATTNMYTDRNSSGNAFSTIQQLMQFPLLPVLSSLSPSLSSSLHSNVTNSCQSYFSTLLSQLMPMLASTHMANSDSAMPQLPSNSSNNRYNNLTSLHQQFVLLQAILSLIRAAPTRAVSINFVRSVFHSCYVLHQRLREYEATRAAEDAAEVLYKEKAILIEGDDEKQKRQMKELFPSYEDEFVHAAAAVAAETDSQYESSSNVDNSHQHHQRDKEQSNDNYGSYGTGNHSHSNETSELLSGKAVQNAFMAENSAAICDMVNTHYVFYNKWWQETCASQATMMPSLTTLSSSSEAVSMAPKVVFSLDQWLSSYAQFFDALSQQLRRSAHSKNISDNYNTSSPSPTQEYEQHCSMEMSNSLAFNEPHENTETREQLLMNGFMVRTALLERAITTSQSNLVNNLADYINVNDAKESSTPQSTLLHHEKVQKSNDKDDIYVLFDSKDSIDSSNTKKDASSNARTIDNTFDIFHDSHVAEARKITQPLIHLLNTLHEYLEQFPDNVPLQRCERVARKVAALPALSTPLMKIMSGVEILLRECYEWERNASTQFSLMPHMNKFASIILHWRRVELHSWRHVLRSKQKACCTPAMREWFILYDLIHNTSCESVLEQEKNSNNGDGIIKECMKKEVIAYNNKEEHESSSDVTTSTKEEVAKVHKMSKSAMSHLAKLEHSKRVCDAVTRFMWNATLGDFAVRLRILKSFAREQLSRLELEHASVANVPLTNTLLHLCAFFDQFTLPARQLLQEKMRPIEEDMHEFVSVMRWQDATYYAVRASSEKSHLQLERALSATDAVCRTPLLPLLISQEEQYESDPAMGLEVCTEHIKEKQKHKKMARTKQTKSSEQQQHSSHKKSVKESKTNEHGKRQRRSNKNKKKSDDNDHNGSKDEDDDIDDSNDFPPSTLLPWQVREFTTMLDFFTESSNDIISRVQSLQAPNTAVALKMRGLKTLFDVLSETGVGHTHELQVQSFEELFARQAPLIMFEETLLPSSIENSTNVSSDKYNTEKKSSANINIISSHNAISHKITNNMSHTHIQDASLTLYRWMRWLQKMRSALPHPHKDLSNAQVQRGSGIAETLFAHVLPAIEVINKLSQLRKQLAILHLFASPHNFVHTSHNLPMLIANTSLVSKTKTSTSINVVMLLRRCVEFAFYTQTFVQSLQYLQAMPLQNNTHNYSNVNSNSNYYNTNNARTINMQSTINSDKTTLHEFAIAASHLITLCNKYNLLIEHHGLLFYESKETHIPDFVVNAFAQAISDLHTRCEHLSCSADQRVSAAAVQHLSQINVLRASLLHALSSSQQQQEQEEEEQHSQESNVSLTSTYADYSSSDNKNNSEMSHEKLKEPEGKERETKRARMEHFISDTVRSNSDKVNSITDNAVQENEYKCNNDINDDDETNMHSSILSSCSESLSSMLSSTLRTVEKALLTSSIKRTYATMQKDDNTTVHINTEIKESYDSTNNNNNKDDNIVDSSNTSFGEYCTKLQSVNGLLDDALRCVSAFTAHTTKTHFSNKNVNNDINRNNDCLREMSTLVESRTNSMITNINQVQYSTIELLHSHARFGLVLTRLFTILMKNGFCKTDKDDKDENDENNENGDGDGGAEGLQQGTGMDDGQGEKDVTNEIENEDQLMSMKDKEEQEKNEGDKDGNDEQEEEEKEDNAADVETDFVAPKEKRDESGDENEDDNSDDDDNENSEESEVEMGSVDGDEVQERKKMRQDPNKNDNYDENDEEHEVEEVSADDVDDENMSRDENDEDNDEEKQNKAEDAIRNAKATAKDDAKREHELVGDDNDSNNNEDDSDSDVTFSDDDDEEEGSDDNNTAVDKNNDKDNQGDDDEDDNESSTSNFSLSDGDDDSEDEEKEKQDTKDKERDERDMSDHDRSSINDDEENEDGDEEEEDSSQASDRYNGDENQYDGGEQDERDGNEAVKRSKRNREGHTNNEEDKETEETNKEKDNDDEDEKHIIGGFDEDDVQDEGKDNTSEDKEDANNTEEQQEEEAKRKQSGRQQQQQNDDGQQKNKRNKNEDAQHGGNEQLERNQSPTSRSHKEQRQQEQQQQQQQSAQHNPYQAVKEAMKRHERNQRRHLPQQLNLQEHVHIRSNKNNKKDDQSYDDMQNNKNDMEEKNKEEEEKRIRQARQQEKKEKVHDNKDKDENDDDDDESDVAEFEFDESGNNEGLAATNEDKEKHHTRNDQSDSEEDNNNNDNTSEDSENISEVDDNTETDKNEAERDNAKRQAWQKKLKEEQEREEEQQHRNNNNDEEDEEEEEDAKRQRRRNKNGQAEMSDSSDDDDASGRQEQQKNKKRKNEKNKNDDKGRHQARMLAKIRKDDKASEEYTDDSEEEQEEGKGNSTDDANVALVRGRQMWIEQELHVQGLSQQLCEQLRLILAPTLADKLQGDYKTGKRLNMKRIIPYIASQFKKDRIWLRRTKPNKRTYQIMVAVDDSLSMQVNHAGIMSCRAVALLTKALQQLEVGEVGVACFGKELTIVHDLAEPFVAESGPRAFSAFTFAQSSTNLKLFFEGVLDYLDHARERMHGQTRSVTEQLQQVLFVISDGQITEDRAELRKLMVRAEEHHQMVVFVLLDIKAATDVSDSNTITHNTNSANLAGNGNSEQTHKTSTSTIAAPPRLTSNELQKMSVAERMRRLKAEREARLRRVKSNSVLDMQLVSFDKNNKVIRKSYMEDFPFPYYLIVREINALPEIIADAMRQWFELLNGTL